VPSTGGNPGQATDEELIEEDTSTSSNVELSGMSIGDRKEERTLLFSRPLSYMGMVLVA